MNDNRSDFIRRNQPEEDAMKKRTSLALLILGVGVLLFACGKKGEGGSAKSLSVSVPAVLPADIERDVMSQEDSKVMMENWKKYKEKVVAWTGTVVAPDEYELAASSRDFTYSGKTLVVVQVNAMRVQIPSPTAFPPGTNVFFVATLSGFAATSGSGQKIYLDDEGLEIKKL